MMQEKWNHAVNHWRDTHTQDVIDLCRNVIPYFVNSFFSRYIQDYKLYLGYKGDRAKKIQSWQTNINVPLVPAIVDTMYSSMYDSKMKFNLNGWVEGQDILLNKAFDYKYNGRNVLLEAIKEAIITGKGFIKPYFNKYTEDIIINGVNYGKTHKRPELTYISIFDIFYDYNGTMEDSPFFIERHIMSRKNIIKRYKADLNKGNKDESYIDMVIGKDGQRFCDYDYNRVRNILAYEDLIVREQKDTTAHLSTTVWERNRNSHNADAHGLESSSIEHSNNVFGVDFEKNKVYEVIEYRDEDGLTVLVDGELLLRKKEKQFIGKVYDISFSRIPGTSDSTGISTNIWDLQTMINTLQNIHLDGLKMNTSPMYEQVGWLNQMLGNKNKIVYEPFKIVPTNTAGALKKIEMGVGSFEPVNAVQFLEGMAEKRVGVNEYIIWGQGKVERVSGGVDLIFNQYKSKLMPITNSVNEAMGKIARDILIMYAMYFSKSELIDMGLKKEYKVVDLINEDGITFQLTSLALLDKEEGLKHLLDNLGPITNLMGGTESPNIDSREVLKAVLTKEVDIDKMFPDKKPVQPQMQMPGGQTGMPQAPQWAGGTQQSGLIQMAQNLASNQQNNG